MRYLNTHSKFLIACATACILWQVFWWTATSAPPLADPQPTTVLTGEQQQLGLNQQLRYFIDQSGQLTLDDIQQSQYASQFIPVTAQLGEITGGQQAIWIRLPVIDQSTDRLDWVLEYPVFRVDEVTFYLVDQTGQAQKTVETGKLYPFETRDLPHRFYVFDVPLPKQENQTIYLRLRDAGRVPIALTFWSLPAFNTKVQQELVFLGIFFGSIIIMIGYNTILALTLRDRNYALYVAYLSLVLWYALATQGLGAQYLWPESILLNDGGWVASISFSLIGSVVLAMSVLQTHQYAPFQHRLAKIWLVILTILTIIRVPGSVGFSIANVFIVFWLFGHRIHHERAGVVTRL